MDNLFAIRPTLGGEGWINSQPLSGKFLDSYDPSHAREDVEGYGHYFLGAVVVSHKRNQRFLVDGQQRLTTLTLLLIYLAHRQAGRPDAVDVSSLIYSQRFGRKSFNLDVPERADVMQCLLDGEPLDLEQATASTRNLAARYAYLVEQFPERIDEHALPYFVDWLREHVQLVEIEAFADEDAYTIFETMNDRGLSLSKPDMLKGYLLANIRREEDQRGVNALWRQHMQAFDETGADESADFFKNWLRARYAQTIRQGAKGEEKRDYDRIGSDFHRWVRERRELLGLTDSDSFVRFAKRDLDFYARQARAVRDASQRIVEGWESVYFNEERGFTLQHQVLLAPLVPSDSAQEVRQKVALVADFLDIWVARRVWNYRTIAYSSVLYTIFGLTRDVRGLSLPALSSLLRQRLDEQPESFVSQPRLRLHQQNYRQVRHLLARMTHWVDAQAGLVSHFQDLVSQGRARPFEIEHIWADHPERLSDHFAHASDFETARNRLGGLLLLQRGLNQSLGDATYEDKRDAYVTKGENLLARSLHPAAYQNNPGFAALITRTKLPFRPYGTFGPEEQAERQELYIRIAEWVWNPSRLDLDGVRPPVHLPVLAAEADENDAPKGTERKVALTILMTQLLSVAATRLDLCAGVKVGTTNYALARRHGQYWGFVVLQQEVRIELYLDGPDVMKTKGIFDALYAHRAEIETAFGGRLTWERMDAKRASRIATHVVGGWSDESTWPAVIESAVGALERLYGALGPRLVALTGE